MLTAMMMPPAEVTQPATTIMSWVAWLITLFLVARIMFLGGRMGWERYNASEPPRAVTELILTLVGGIIMGSAAAWVTWLM